MVNSIYKKLVSSPILAFAAIVSTAVTTMPVGTAFASISTGQCEGVWGHEVHVYITEVLENFSPDDDHTGAGYGDYYTSVSIAEGQEALSDVIEDDHFYPEWHFHRFVSYEEPVWLPDSYGAYPVLAISLSLIDEDASRPYDELLIEELVRFDTDFQEETYRFSSDYASMEVVIESFETTDCASSLSGDSV
jgi:hypothetical protein